MKSISEIHIEELLTIVVDDGSRELHLRSGRPPFARMGAVTELSAYEALRPIDLQQMIYGILSDDEIIEFERAGSLSFTYTLGRRAQFDAQLIRSQGTLEADFQAVPGPA